MFWEVSVSLFGHRGEYPLRSHVSGEYPLDIPTHFLDIPLDIPIPQKWSGTRDTYPRKQIDTCETLPFRNFDAWISWKILKNSSIPTRETMLAILLPPRSDQAVRYYNGCIFQFVSPGFTVKSNNPCQIATLCPAILEFSSAWLIKSSTSTNHGVNIHDDVPINDPSAQ